MVTKLEVPEIEDITLLPQIIEERNEPNKTYFTNIFDVWVQRINIFEAENGNPEAIPGSPVVNEIDGNKFRNLYLKPINTVDSEIISVLREHDLAHCPFCGGIGVPITLDHYLPKDKFPEFSIFSKNLVPMCGGCQIEKSNKTVDADGNKFFVHPYFDIDEDTEILCLEIIPPYDIGTDFMLTIKNNIVGDERNLLLRHFNEINIEERFVKYFRGQYKRLKKLSFQIKYLEMGNRNTLEVRFRDAYNNALLHGYNHWDAVFFKAVLNNNDLIDYLAAV